MTSAPAPTRPASLPRPLTPFIGRQREIAVLRDLLLREDVRLVTLTGSGGVGKTRLAIAVVESSTDAFAGNVWYVPLEAIRDPDLVPIAVANVVEVQEHAERQLAETIAGRFQGYRALLVLDNFEQVLVAAAFLDELLAACRDLTLLVTSRASLNLYGEYAVAVPPLALADAGGQMTLAQATVIPSIQMFIQRAQAAESGFMLTEANVAAIAEICSRLDGLPLAIELAAARIRMLTPAMLLERLAQPLPVLAGGARNVAERHQTMRASIAWSYGLLPPREQRLIQQLAVFSGGWNLEAAEAICDPAEDVFDGLSALVDHSLVRQTAQPDGSQRFTMLETIREFALEQLTAGGLAQEPARRHVAYFAALPKRTLPSAFAGEELAARLATFEPDLANFRAALAWLLDRDPEAALTLALDLTGFWKVRSQYSEARRWIESVLADTNALSFRGRALGMKELSNFVVWQGDYALAEQLAAEAADRFAALHDQGNRAEALFAQARARGFMRDDERAIQLYEQVIELQRELGDPASLSGPLGNMGVLISRQGDLDRAERLLEEALAVARRYGLVLASVFWLVDLGHLALKRGSYDHARALLAEGLAMARELRNVRMIVDALEGFALLAHVDGRPDRAVRLYSAAGAARVETRLSRQADGHLEYEPIEAELRAVLGAEAYANAISEGRTMSLDAAVEDALSAWTTTPAAAASAPTVLSKRELEVLRLLTDGKTNQEIAAALFISPNTVTNHVTSILNKLGLDSRTAAATFAVRHGLV